MTAYKNVPGRSFSYDCNFMPDAHNIAQWPVRLHDVRPSVCPSVWLDHIGWKSWKLTAWTISSTFSLFVAQRPSTYSQWNMGKFGGD